LRPDIFRIEMLDFTRSHVLVEEIPESLLFLVYDAIDAVDLADIATYPQRIRKRSWWHWIC